MLLSDVLLWTGGAAFATGLFGRYFFIIPVVQDSAGWGHDFFTLGVPAVDHPLQYPSAAIKAYLMVFFGLSEGTVGMDKEPPGSNGYGTGKDTNWLVGTGNAWGPLGQRGGFLFLAMIAGGLAVKYYFTQYNNDVPMPDFLANLL